MLIFILIYISFYGSLHAYAFYKANAAFNFGAGATIIISAVMAFMIFAPLIVRFAEHAGLENTARIIAYIAYIWMGALAFFCLFAIIIGVYRLMVFCIGGFFCIDTAAIYPSTVTGFTVPLILTVVSCVFGIYEAFNIRTEKVIIKSSKLSEITNPLKIVQISDVHLGIMTGDFRLERIIKLINESEPDMLISTGDLVDGQIDNIEISMKLFEKINPKFGKYAVTGNHEVYAGLPLSVRLTESGGFRILRDEAVHIAGITLAGVDDTGHSLTGNVRADMVKHFLSNLPGDKFTIFLKHNPSVLKGTEGLFDLQISGHLHSGQIFPFIPLVRIFYPYLAGLHELSGGSSIYISRGTGFWGPPMRVLAPPEITVFELIPQ